MDVAFVVGGGHKHGLGHVYHTVAIAESLGGEVDPLFVTASGETVQRKIRDNGFDVRVVGSRENLGDVVASMSPDVVVFDMPLLDVSDILPVKQRTNDETSVVVIGNRNRNLPDGVEGYCDVVVDFDIGDSQRPEGYYYDLETDTLNLVGLKYHVFRPRFYDHVDQPAEGARDPAEISRVLLLFGGSDPSNFSSTALSILLNSNVDYEIEVVLGAGFSGFDAFESVLREHPEDGNRIRVEEDVSDVPSRIESADVVVTSPGLTMLEALMLNRPVVAFCQNELQYIWRSFPFVHDAERIDELASLIHDAYVSFPKTTEQLPLDFVSGKREVLRVLSGIHSHERAHSATAGDGPVNNRRKQ